MKLAFLTQLSDIYNQTKSCVYLIMGLLITAQVNAVDIKSIQNGTKSSDVTLTSEQIAVIKNKSLTAALVWHGSSPWVNAVTQGAKTEFKKLGIKVITITDAQFDPAKQVADLENISALNPDIILSLSVDGVSTKSSYQKVISKGAKLVLLSNPIPGFELGKDYVGIVTDDMFGMGKAAAELVAQAVNNQGNIGMIYHDAKYFITNNRDQAFKAALEKYNNINISAEKGFVKEHETNSIASAMILQNPDLEAIYVSWDAAAEGVIEALRAHGRKNIKVITHDLGINNLVDMAMGGNLYGTISDRPFDIGQTMARLGGASTLGLKAAPFTIVPFDFVRKHNMRAIWEKAFKTPLPKMLDLALKQSSL
ncbi:substrate-binding domain-containing protein [Pseudoalteromonas denitrificans]|uniref:Monosaccharide ABC transporter substrate-binding protein, CUT2 family (TC 3.A.1.2.-) n=1 Tax=Pseudoalteromonas denitrificans DSM 6059 TaxID=1123010 RepID=A0A1I1N5R7_9GAMM|nr:substrate-binding domain-containing protein [Pseudoalteromonas denitrificans]SFC93017.1 monosaccharide ABC transporter substrate-binding protein, CUT2 family (TC 3.A.1.2.-) [Pseudoalteromonas denitrificans DSM 6059]